MDVWLMIATWFERGVLALLLALSIWSIAIMIDRRRIFRREISTSDLDELRSLLIGRKVEGVKAWLAAHRGIHAGVLRTAMDQGAHGDAEQVDRSVRSFLISERLKLEKGLPVLATLGANTPFIGLFGTVLGIIRAFAALGENSAGASSVMSGISQALIATAAGLFVAIPAVVAFNVFSNRLKAAVSECESLRDLFVARWLKIEMLEGRASGSK